MSFLKKLFILVILFFLVYGGYRYYKHTHPQYIPPPVRAEVTLTIIPGWNLRQVAEYLVLKGFATSSDEVFAITGVPGEISKTDILLEPFDSQLQSTLESRPRTLSYEGYLAPQTFRVFADAPVSDVIGKFLVERDQYFTSEGVLPDIFSGHHTVHQILTMASIIEKETKRNEDRPLVADILWRRLKRGMALQVDSSVHYAIDKIGDVYTTDKEREIDSPWNTYKYPGLPPGPICNPSLDSIKAALNPTANDYWYFLSDKDGVIHYAKTLDEQNANRVKYL